jgi:hypothetical protein
MDQQSVVKIECEKGKEKLEVRRVEDELIRSRLGRRKYLQKSGE